MPFYKFQKFDQFINIVKTYPKSNFLIWSGSMYYNNTSQSGSNINTPDGHINLFEMNVNRDASVPAAAGMKHHHPNGAVQSELIYPFLIKDEKDLLAMKSMDDKEYFKAQDASALQGVYPLTSTISREFYNYTTEDYDTPNYLKNNYEIFNKPILPNETWPQHSLTSSDHGLTPMGKLQDQNIKSAFFNGIGRRRRRLEALKNTLNYYTYMSPHYAYSSSIHARDLSKQKLTLISIPSIFYGTSIKEGSVNLKFYVTGTLCGELADEKGNGELIQVGPSYSIGSGSCAGVVLYNEGFIILTGSYNLQGVHQEEYVKSTKDYPKWIHFGASMPTSARFAGTQIDGNAAGGSSRTMWSSDKIFAPSSSFALDFKGTNHTPTVTMLAHAPKSELNHSNNFTYLSHNSLTSSSELTMVNKYSYTENEKIKIKNTIKSEYDNYNEEFQKQTYISKIGIYDKDKNLIAVAKVVNPVRKKEERDMTFKMKLDM